MRGWSTVAAAGSVIMIVAGCASSSGSQLKLQDGTTVLVGADRHGQSFTAAIGGQVVDVDHQCLGLETGGGTPSVLVLDHGTTVTSDGTGVITPEGVTLHVGDRIAGGGGQWELTDEGPGSDWKDELPACWALGSMVAINSVELQS